MVQSANKELPLFPAFRLEPESQGIPLRCDVWLSDGPPFSAAAYVTVDLVKREGSGLMSIFAHGVDFVAASTAASGSIIFA